MASLKDALVKSGLATAHEVALSNMDITALRRLRDAVIRNSLGLPTLPLHKGLTSDESPATLLAINAAINKAEKK